jgi:hypothetical protein
MARKSIIAFLIKIGPVFFGLLWLWHGVGISHVYHEALAGLLGWVYPPLDPSGVVRGAAVEGHEILLRLLVGETKTTLAINAEDITSNFAMLAALYLSAPPRWRRLALFFPTAVVILFLLHAVTVMTLSQEAFIGNPEILRLGGYTQAQANFFVGYNTFFEQMGMYLYPLVLWFPYVLLSVLETGRSEATQERA